MGIGNSPLLSGNTLSTLPIILSLSPLSLSISQYLSRNPSTDAFISVLLDFIKVSVDFGIGLYACKLAECFEERPRMREVISSRGSALLAKRSLNGPPSLSHSVPLEIQRNLDYVWAETPSG